MMKGREKIKDKMMRVNKMSNIKDKSSNQCRSSNFKRIMFAWYLLVCQRREILYLKSEHLSKCARIPPSSAGGMNGFPSPLGGEG